MTKTNLKRRKIRLEVDPDAFRARAERLKLSDEQLMEMLRMMYTIRQFETMADKLYAMGKVHGTMHLSARQVSSPALSTMNF